jgi:hypothetical protein
LQTVYTKYRELQSEKTKCTRSNLSAFQGVDFDELCDLQTKFNRIIVHIGEETLKLHPDNLDKILYIPVCSSSEIDVDDLVQFVSVICVRVPSIQTLIFASSSPNSRKILQKFVAAIEKDAYILSLHDVTIIYDVDQVSNTIESKKIKNFINAHWQISSSLTFGGQKFDLKSNRLKSYFSYYESTFDKSIKRVYMYPIPDIESEMSEMVEDKWWYKLFTGVPRCSQGRLIQVDGICWFNSILNGILLGTSFKRILFQKLFKEYATVEEREKLEVLFTQHEKGESCPYNPKDLIYGIIQRVVQQKDHIVVDEFQPSNPVGYVNPVKLGATRNMSNAVKYSRNATHCEMCTGPGFSTSQGLQRILTYLLPKNEYIIFDVWGDDVETIVEKIPSISKPEVLVLKYSHMRDTEAQIHQQIGDYVLDFATFEGQTEQLPMQGHAIVGLSCGGETYIYDSNNILAKTNWISNDLSGYYEKCFELDVHYGFEFKPTVLLYTLKSSTGGKKMSNNARNQFSDPKYTKSAKEHVGDDGISRIVYVKGTSQYVKRRRADGTYQYVQIRNCKSRAKPF